MISSFDSVSVSILGQVFCLPRHISKGAVTVDVIEEARMFSWGEIHFAKTIDLAENRYSENDIQSIPTTKPIITSFSATYSTVAFTKSDGRAYFLRRQRNQDGHWRLGKTSE